MSNFKPEGELVEIDSSLPTAVEKNSAVARSVWKRFIWKNVLIYAGTNVFFNSVIPYNSFENPDAVHLFQGTYCIARFLLPLAFFIPLLITIDTSNKTRDLFRKKTLDFAFPDGFRYKNFLLKQSLVNSSLTFAATLGFMAILHFSAPQGYTFRGIIVSVIMGIYAGAVALYFMKRTIDQLREVGIVKIADL